LFSTDGHSAPAVTPSCARLVEWIVDRLESRLPQEPASTAATARVRDVEDWIEAHLHEPITLGRLCEAAGVGARSLQLAFEARRHATPMEFVMERRLAAAHARLVADRGESSVTSVAASVGMEHLGRFAASYRRFYGEPPSATLRRRLPQAAAEGLHGDGAGVSQR
jgi:transcriptional regulator GlxA family with amidase domain